ncbi:MAG: tRNA (adenosine(37)-N6)-threonylcarbamoyltransferase complex dimerization subunit type 1 TsaB [Saprospiraceae bacterium]|nr:tRNA (adenosine(37)-N6)-threonylcarbamoyltransferase complex dimerization subunit type 1 TsaB [Saprospiraceae bacterium]
MALILNIESATNICSVSIARAGVVQAIFETNTNNHASEITLLIEQCIAATGVALNELDAIAVSHGPGSYTSLRVGASTAKGICYALNKPLIAVDTLHALAHGAYLEFGDKTTLYCPMIDARRMEVYTAIYAPILGENTEGVVLKEKLNNLIVEDNSFERYFSERGNG